MIRRYVKHILKWGRNGKSRKVFGIKIPIFMHFSCRQLSNLLKRRRKLLKLDYSEVHNFETFFERKKNWSRLLFCSHNTIHIIFSVFSEWNNYITWMYYLWVSTFVAFLKNPPKVLSHQHGVIESIWSRWMIASGVDVWKMLIN